MVFLSGSEEQVATASAAVLIGGRWRVEEESRRPGLQWSQDLGRIARSLHREVARSLADAHVPGELSLTGALCVPGVLTRGDVDLHLRVPPALWHHAVAGLQDVFPVVSPEIWCDTLATFGIPAAVPAGLAATPAGSEHDVRFTRTWQLLAAGGPALVSELNSLKSRAWTTSFDEYELQKSAFFDRLLSGDTLP